MWFLLQHSPQKARWVLTVPSVCFEELFASWMSASSKQRAHGSGPRSEPPAVVSGSWASTAPAGLGHWKTSPGLSILEARTGCSVSTLRDVGYEAERRERKGETHRDRERETVGHSLCNQSVSDPAKGLSMGPFPPHCLGQLCPHMCGSPPSAATHRGATHRGLQRPLPCRFPRAGF